MRFEGVPATPVAEEFYRPLRASKRLVGDSQELFGFYISEKEIKDVYRIRNHEGWWRNNHDGSWSLSEETDI